VLRDDAVKSRDEGRFWAAWCTPTSLADPVKLAQQIIPLVVVPLLIVGIPLQSGP
jgi:hypothetical protein